MAEPTPSPAPSVEELIKDLRSVTWLAPVSAVEMTIRDRWMADVLESELRRLRREHERAMKVLDPSMPESGLVDACRQVKQVAISEADNSAQLEATVTRLREALTDAKRAMENHNEHAHEVPGQVADDECAFDFVGSIAKLQAALSSDPPAQT